jgi:uncharacterized alkaline shock family protein YloU
VAVTVDLHADHLDCGTELAALVEQVADGAGTTLTGHQRGCAYCRAALTELLLRWGPVRRVATAPVAVPAGLRQAVLRRLRRLAPHDGYARWLAEAGRTQVAGWVLGRICTTAAGRVPGVAAVGSARATPVVGADLGAPPDLTVELDIVAAADRPLPDTAAAARAAIAADLRRYAGMTARRIDVTITDIRNVV